MSIILRAHNSRGKADFGWLQSHHSFSFGRYYDVNHMGVSALRVINEDTVAPGMGFDTHSHANMEIISYVLSGEIAHKDSQGNVARLPAGEFQLMSAGRGISHSEYNLAEIPLHFLQIWIKPNVENQAPGYQQKRFGTKEGLTLVASPDGAHGSLVIKQDARLYHINARAQTPLQLGLEPSRSYYLHLISGRLQVNSASAMTAGDALTIQNEQSILIQPQFTPVQALWFDLP